MASTAASSPNGIPVIWLAGGRVCNSSCPTSGLLVYLEFVIVVLGLVVYLIKFVLMINVRNFKLIFQNVDHAQIIVYLKELIFVVMLNARVQ